MFSLRNTNVACNAMKLSRSLLLLFLLGALLKLCGCTGQPQNAQKNRTDSLSEEAYKAVEERLAKSDSKKLTLNNIDTISDKNLEQVIVDNISLKVNGDSENEYFVAKELTKPQQMIFIIEQVEAEVNNGGFNQFFYNSSGKFSKDMEDAFKAIDAIKFSELVRKANETYNKHKKEIIKTQEESIDGFEKSYNNNPLNKLDKEFYDLYTKENLSKLKIKFIRSHKNEFVDY